MSLFERIFGRARPVPAAKAPPEHPGARAEKSQDTAAAQAARAQAAERDEQLLQGALTSADAATVARLVLEGASTKVRQQAAAAIQDVEQLRALIKEVRGGNDKSVYKILQAKREQLMAQQRQQEQRQAEVLAVASALERHSHRGYDSLFVPALEQLTTRWQAVAAHADPSLVGKTQEALERAQAVIAKHTQEVAEAAEREQQAAAAAAEARRLREEAQLAAVRETAERMQQVEQAHQAASAQKEAEAAFLRQVGGLIRKAQGALSAGGTSRAAGVRRAIEQKLKNAGTEAGPASLPAHLAAQLQALDKRLEEMKDWKSFSVAPKRQELIESMEALVGADLEPQQLADRIKGLQEEWRTISRGAGENAEEEWQRFHAAAQKAYEPCKEYFATQAQARQENLRIREALAEELAAFEASQNWEAPEWRLVINTLREIKEKWRRASPVERAAGAAVRKRFEALTGSMQVRLDAEYARNVEKKKALIAAAEALLSEEDTRRATEEVKDIQRRWKEVGPVPRAQDQALWEELRRHCDAVFDKRHRGHVELVAGLEARRMQAQALCETLEQIASLSGAELKEKAQFLPEHRAAFDALGELPRQHARELQRRFDRAGEKVERALVRQRALDTEQSWTDLLEAARRIHAYRAAQLSHPPEVVASLKAEAERYMAQVSRWPRGGGEALKKALGREGGDLAAGEAALRQLCIRAEVFTDLPSPPEDQGLRRDYQVQRLMQGMGQGLTVSASELDEVALAWVAAAPAADPPYSALLERFKRCREAHLQRMAD